MTEYDGEDAVITKAKKGTLRRLLAYMKPYWLSMAAAVVMVLCISAMDIYRPLLVGGAIDDYISGYGRPYAYVEAEDNQAIPFEGRYLSRQYQADSDTRYARLVLYHDGYYLFENLTDGQSTALAQAQGDGLAMHDGRLSAAGLEGRLMDAGQLQLLRRYDYQGILHVALIYAVLVLATFIMNIAQMVILQVDGQKIIFQLRQQVFEHVEGLTLRFFDTNPVGRLVTRVTNDTEALSEMYSGILVKLVKSIVVIVGYAAVMLSVNATLALYGFILLPVIIALTFVFRDKTLAIYRVVRAKLTDINTFLSENISGMRVIQIFNRQRRKLDEFKGKNQALYKACMKELLIFAVFRPLINILYHLSLSVVIYKGAQDYLAGALSIGTLYVFIEYVGSFFDPIQELAENFGTLQSSLASGEKVFAVLDEQPAIRQDAHPVMLDGIKGAIEFDHVWFAYDGQDYVLKDVSFIIRPGTAVAFVGATGAGKSSILNLIGRYYDIQKGAIRIDGVDIRRLSIAQLRQAIGQVQQDVFIFAGDVRHNIALDNADMPMSEVRAAAHFANADTFIDRLPQGYETVLTERGSTLSVGQRQLLSFARTLAYKPKILVMDEATANIDTETEQLIQGALANLMKGRTTIMVAHRLSTIQDADDIIVLNHGRICEQGTHQQLLARDGIYRKLYDLQLYEKN